jgi:ABC-type nitrate/sulfonate/bicarbonate transport system substrate-binding protein
MKLAVPDLVSNSYFPALAAAELGFFRAEGLDVALELLSPADAAFAALAAGEVALVAAEAHAALSAFPEWRGVRLVCALAQGMYWFLVMRADLNAKRGELACVRGRRIGAAPSVELGLRRLLRAAGIDPDREVAIAPVPGAQHLKANTGLMAAQALADGLIDGFWANGMGAEIAVRRGIGTIVLDVRRGDGPRSAFGYTFAALAAPSQLISERPGAIAAVRRAIAATHAALRADVTLAGTVGRRLFPPHEAAMIVELVRRDLPYYDVTISSTTVAALNRFARDVGILAGDPAERDVVAG